MNEHTIAFIGGGNMARSLIGGLVADGYPAARIRVADPSEERRDELAGRFGVTVTGDNAEAVDGADAVVLAVKPQVIRDVAESLGGQLRAQHTLTISIAAGVREADLSRWLGGRVAVVRAMPNTPALVQTGATALYANEHVTEHGRNLAESLLRAVGVTEWLSDEALMDAVTAISGSGPAYFFLLMEMMEDAGTELGLPREKARLLTLETALGAARMALESEETPARLRERVTSPNGVTHAVVTALEDGDVRTLYRKALEAGAARARELGDQLGEQ
ncbi:Pyrroline-5-carboxylate reductase [wastewater metagenome]|uniref:Pyrroline-5-carboxylate reductase n=4 Tax=root TaxID=1 RepID=A0A5B8RFQ4_9ZZZZ|nr:pyrroline-5-carboxylate reductase [Arhodomonas aquaeolei]MCS4505571.1 pyrroline-5-carboxylate reductase [Arhodomonas aquaeolei]QEA07416.1 pyrroline-5-carboxylate reductase [uncultured organism]